MNYKTTKGLVKISIALFITIILFAPKNSFAYNKSWDQGHQCTYVNDGTNAGWGRYDYKDNPEFHGWYTTKECCEILCKVCPVYANTGQLQKSFTDLFVHGIGPNLSITRTYNSQDWATSLLGHSWVFNFGRELIITRNNNNEKILGVRQETGEKNFFKEHPDGTIELLSEYGVTYNLVKNPDDTYTINNLDGSRHELNHDGKIEKIIDKNGNELIFEYNTAGCLSKITNASGNYVTFQLGPNGKIASISDNLGRTVSYGYDSNGNLITFTDPMGNVTQYTYNSANLLTQIIDPRGNIVESITYDSYQPPRVITFKEKGETFTITYYSDRTVKKDSSGNSWTYYFNNLGIVEKVIDPLGNVKEQHNNKITSTTIDWEEDLNGNRTNFTYDANGNITSKTDPLGNTWTYAYIGGTDFLESETDPQGVVTKYQYDGNGNLITIIENIGGPLENTTTYTYDDNGNQTSVTDPLGNTTTFEYDLNGQVILITYPMGNTVSFTYDAIGNRISQTDSAGHSVTYIYDLNGNLLSETDSLGQPTVYEYDTGNNIVKKTLPSGAYETFTYDAFGRMLTYVNAASESTVYSYSKTRDTVTTPEGSLQVTVKDALGRVTAIVTKIGDTNPNVVDGDDVVQSFEYDAEGNLLTTKNPDGSILVKNTFNKNNQLIKIEKAGEPAITIEYDASGKPMRLSQSGNTYQYTYNTLQVLTRVEDVFGVLSTREYDLSGNLLIETDKTGQTKQIQYNANGQSQSVLFGDGGYFNIQRNSDNSIGTITSNNGFMIRRDFDAAGRLNRLILPDQSEAVVTYDALGYISSLTDTKGNTSTFQIDQVGRRIRETFQDGLQRSFTYKGSLLSSFTNRAGQTTQYQYDGDSRLVRILPPESQNDLTFTYNQTGSMTSARTGTHLATFSYGQDTHMTSTTSDGRTITYNRSADNRTHIVNYPSGLQVKRNYDERGRLLSIAVDGLSLCQLTWSEAQPDTLQLGNGITGSYGYGADKVLTSQTFQLGNDTLQHIEYVTQPMGLITGVRDHVNPSASESYTRDKRGRLIDFNRGVMDDSYTISSPLASQSWQFDSMDNWNVFVNNGVSHNRVHDSFNRLTQEDQTVYTYDAVGNLVGDGIRTYAYDFQNNLILVTLPDGSMVSYAYDALGRRISKTVNGLTTTYVYDNNRLVETYVDGQLYAFYVYLNYSSNPDDVIAAQINGNWYYFLKNIQGSVVALTDAAGVIVEKYSYDPYGSFTVVDGNNQPIGQSLNIHFFAGMLYDHECGLYYARSRYYNPKLGRFLSPDPLSWLASGGTSNDYAFAESDPVMHNDPFGKIPPPSKQCSGHRIQLAVPNLGIFEKLIGKPKGEFLVDYKTCERCCSGGPYDGQVVSEKSLSMTAQIKWSSPCIPVVIPFLPPLGWKTPTGACAGLFLAGDFSAQGSAFIQQDKCSDYYKGGGCIGLGFNAWLRGGYSSDILDAWAGGALTGNGKACLVGKKGDSVPHVTFQACIGGKLSARIQLKKISIWFIKKPYYEYTFWQGSWCTPTWEIL